MNAMNSRNESLTFGDWLKQRRKALDLTQEQLADRASCSLETIRKVEAGTRRPSREMVEALAQRLAVPPEERAALVEFARVGSAAYFTSPPSLNVWMLKRASSLNTLPRPRTTFIGRASEMEVLRSLLRREDVRLLTVTGAGGTGKTRLAIQVAAGLRQDIRDGVFFVSLAPIIDPALVTATIARALGISETPDQPLNDSIKRFLGDKRLLLVLDNFEQVLEASPLVAELLSEAPDLKIMVTSREPLRLYGEHAFPVHPLQLPHSIQVQSLEDLYRYEAINLFVQRAMLVKPDFTLNEDNAPVVARICQRLDGLPLAIELAAARINVLPPQAMLSRMEDRLNLLTRGARNLSSRQQTLRNTIEWSYNLLSEGEARLFRRLAIFAGGCTFSAIQAICDCDIEGDFSEGIKVNALEGVASLVDKSVLRQDNVSGEPRFWMLETIREFAREKLQQSGEWETIAKEHALYFMKLAEEAEPQLVGPNQQEWLDRLEEESNNVRAALHWALEDIETGEGPENENNEIGESERERKRAREREKSERVEIGLRTAGAAWRLWLVRGYLTERREELGRLLSASARLGSPNLPGLSNHSKQSRVKALNGLGTLAERQGLEPWAARRALEEALSIGKEIGDKKSMAMSLNVLGNLATAQCEYASARLLYEESLLLRRELGDERGVAGSLNNLGQVAHLQGDYEKARVLYEESLALARLVSDKFSVAEALANLGSIATNQKHYQKGRALQEESLLLRRELGDKTGIANSLIDLGNVAFLWEADYISACSLYEESQAVWRELVSVGGIAISLISLGSIAFLQEDYKKARSLYWQSLKTFKELGDKWVSAWCIAELGAVAAVIGDAEAKAHPGETERGTRMMGAAEALRERIGVVMQPEQRPPYELGLAAARARLGEEEFRRAWQEGRALSMEQAIDYTLDDTSS